MSKIFEKIGVGRPKKSAFDLSHERKLSCNMGDLVPIYMDEILPGDQFKVSTETMMRLAPMLAPIMHRVNVYVHYFYVPNRIIWSQWEDFITGGREGTSTPSMPTVGLNSAIRDSKLADYLGVPRFAQTTTEVTISQLPFRAYQQIYNDYYRDQNLEEPIDIISGTDRWVIRKRAWEKDYFTSALPWTQRGPSVGVPLDQSNIYRDVSKVVLQNDDIPSGSQDLSSENIGGSANFSTSGQGNARLENLSDQAGIDINALRTSSALQRWLEKQARGGARYIETILSHFGVKSSDARLQRAEYLGGGRQPIVISEVLNTTGTTEAPQGDMAGHGISTGVTNSFKRHFEEHGYVFGIMSVLPRTAYYQGIPRHWLRRDKTEFYWPEFANLGEQEIKKIEVLLNTVLLENNEETFGYQQRYAEYKHAQSTVHGDFRTTLNFWHMARNLPDAVQLNKDFVMADPTHRIFAVDDPEEDKLWVQIYNRVHARRPMPYFSNPQLR